VLSGDLATMALPDVLQWVDAHRARALITLERPDAVEPAPWLIVDDRVVVAAAAPPARGELAADGTPAAPGPGLVALTRECLLDAFLSNEGRFVLRTSFTVPERAVALDTPVQFLLMEGLRLLDEWPRLQRTYPTDAARLAATDAQADDLSPIHGAIRRVALEAPALGEARLVLGLSRAALLRQVNELRRQGLVEVEGTPHGPDVESGLIEQARVLLREAQYAEAAHVFRSLLTSNPDDGRARALLREAERRQLETLQRRFAATDVVSRAAGVSTPPRLRSGDLAVLEQLERARSVAVLTLVSPLRELETLLALRRLLDKGCVRIESAD
jgi:hypothetical protein